MARGTGSVLLWQLAGLALGYALHVVLARWMGAAEYGRFTYVLAWVALMATPVGLGWPVLVVRLVPEYQTQQAWQALRGVLQGGVGSVLVLGGVVLAAFFIGIQWFGERLTDYVYPLMVGVWLIPLQALMNLTGGTLRGLQLAGWQYAIAPLRHGLLLGAVLLIIIGGEVATSEQVLGIVLAVTLLVLLVMGIIVIRKLPAVIWQAKATYQLHAWLHISLPLMLVAVFAVLINQTDILMVGSLLGPYDTGLYRAASRTASLVGLGPIAVRAAADAVLVRRFAHRDLARLQQLASVTVRWSVALALGVSMVLLGAGGVILGLFGPAFVASRGILAVLVMAQLVSACIGMAVGLLLLTGHHRWGMLVFGAGAGLNVVFNSIGIVLFGSIGAAFATLLATICLSIGLWWQARRLVNIDASIIYALWNKADVESDI
ncbi:MAG TPA: oligosaccharide flippase family protein [Rhodothermales bacterium]|nr:oligosaccharide flippase family protein [Rhodothermales bacterium]